MNKKYLIIGGGVIVFIILVISIFFSLNTPKQQQTTSQPSTPLNQTQESIHQITTNKTVPTITLAPPANTPQAAVEQFYNYYFMSSRNPLANGAFETNPYLASDFKSDIGRLYDNGNTPVFCPDNKSSHIVVGQETPIDYSNAVLMEEIISEAPPGTKDLYRVLVQNVNGKWLIYSIDCLP